MQNKKFEIDRNEPSIAVYNLSVDVGVVLVFQHESFGTEQQVVFSFEVPAVRRLVDSVILVIWES